MLWLGLASLAYYFLLIATGTDFFFALHGGGHLTPVQVWGAALLLLGQVLAIPLRRKHPLMLFCVVMTLFFASMVLVVDRNAVANLPQLFAVYALTAVAPRRTWSVAIGVTASCDVILQLLISSAYGVPPSPVFILTYLTRSLSTYVPAIPVGLLVRVNRQRAELAHEVAESAKREQKAVALAAAANERTSMARELHDVAAYHLSGILMQSEAAVDAIRHHDADADEIVAAVREEAVLTWRSLRDLVQVLRTDIAENTPAGAAPLAELDMLVETARRNHASVTLAVDGELGDVSPAAALGCYRIVQESLTNATKYAAGSTIEVTLARDLDNLVLNIRNTQPTHVGAAAGLRGGQGLAGMKERASLLGGDLSSGPTEDGGWATTATIPAYGLSFV